MAKLQGPLFSFAASGTLAGKVTYQSTSFSKTARLKPTNKKPTTINQLTIRAEMKNCAASWRTLSSLQKQLWKNLVNGRQLTPFAKYTIEWHAQRATPQNPPWLPAA